ncbi:hypothetical protein [Nocardia sp. NBC_00416]|uniref:hypothetical protein n=1 Tax=Nocardia sp. NBC_00416 TaxID=2975991 RepID=UPI002E1A5B66
MRLGHPTREELIQNFEAELASVCSGGGLRSETGLDMETDEALWTIARAYPNVSDELVAAAKEAFAGQLDGSNTERHREDLARQIEEMRRIRDGA